MAGPGVAPPRRRRPDTHIPTSPMPNSAAEAGSGTAPAASGVPSTANW